VSGQGAGDEALSTALIHHPYRPPEGFEAVPVGVYKASTVIYPNLAALRASSWKSKQGYTYGLHGTPTTFTLEERIATLEGGRHTLLTPSGLSAIVMVDLALLQQGDEVLLPSNVYNPSQDFAQAELSRWGIAHRFYDPMRAESLAEAIGERTKLVWLEAPGSVTMEFPDLRALVRVCRERGVTCALDNTWGAGVAFRPFELGDGLSVDLVMHALTKYPSGAGDVLMGAVTTVDDRLHQRLSTMHMRMGHGVGANDAEMVLRSLPTLAVRYAAHDAAARQLAAWLATRPEVSQVLHPALPGAPGHEAWKTHCTAAAGLFSIVVDPRYGLEQVDRFVEALRLFRIGYSWGGPMSLVMLYEHRGFSSLKRYEGTIVRFSIGLEGVEDLRADLEQALAQLEG
jgi:cystathionine beta-lyase